MTGIERLRKLSKGMHNHGMTVWQLTDDAYAERFGVTKHGPTIKNFLSDIADQIERESDVETVRSDAMEAWEWVRAHGGLDHVKAEWSSRVPHDIYERRRQRLLGHIAECEAALGRRNVRIEELGHRVSDLTRENAELRKRAMPEGCEWPRYESGEPVRIGDAVADELGHAHEVESVEIFDDAEALHWNPSEPDEFVYLVHGARVRRPADTKPKPPNSWERIEEDARLKPLGYVDRVLGWDMRKSHSENQARSAMTHDLVRRCKALAERERGE